MAGATDDTLKRDGIFAVLALVAGFALFGLVTTGDPAALVTAPLGVITMGAAPIVGLLYYWQLWVAVPALVALASILVTTPINHWLRRLLIAIWLIAWCASGAWVIYGLTETA